MYDCVVVVVCFVLFFLHECVVCLFGICCFVCAVRPALLAYAVVFVNCCWRDLFMLVSSLFWGLMWCCLLCVRLLLLLLRVCTVLVSLLFLFGAWFVLCCVCLL